MSSKIIQIIPASPNMWDKWEPDGGEEMDCSPIVCLALMEDEDGGTCVTPMAIGEDGGIYDVFDATNFGGLLLPKQP